MVSSSLQQNAPGSFTTPAPGCSPACHTPITAPIGSAKNAMRPAGPTSIGGTITVPPAATALATVSSALVTFTYDDQ